MYDTGPRFLVRTYHGCQKKTKGFVLFACCRKRCSAALPTNNVMRHTQTQQWHRGPRRRSGAGGSSSSSSSSSRPCVLPYFHKAQHPKDRATTNILFAPLGFLPLVQKYCKKKISTNLGGTLFCTRHITRCGGGTAKLTRRQLQHVHRHHHHNASMTWHSRRHEIQAHRQTQLASEPCYLWPTTEVC